MTDVSEEPVPEPSPSVAHWQVVVATVLAFALALLFGGLITVVIAAIVVLSGGVDHDVAGWTAAIVRTMADRQVSLAAGALGSASALTVAVVALTSGPPGQRRERLRLRPVAPLDAALVVIGMLSLSIALGHLITLAGVQSEALADLRALLEGLDGFERARMLPVLALAAGTAEELYFRGYALTRVERGSGKHVAVAVTALLFGLMHVDPVHAVAAAVMGVFLGYAVIATGSIVPAMIAHVLNNAVQVIAPGLGPESPQGQWILLGVSLLVFVVVARLLFGRSRPEPALFR